MYAPILVSPSSLADARDQRLLTPIPRTVFAHNAMMLSLAIILDGLTNPAVMRWMLGVSGGPMTSRRIPVTDVYRGPLPISGKEFPLLGALPVTGTTPASCLEWHRVLTTLIQNLAAGLTVQGGGEGYVGIDLVDNPEVILLGGAPGRAAIRYDTLPKGLVYLEPGSVLTLGALMKELEGFVSALMGNPDAIPPLPVMGISAQTRMGVIHERSRKIRDARVWFSVAAAGLFAAGAAARWM